jgi:glycosyltransferase involved in cell wall biosynthesis
MMAHSTGIPSGIFKTFFPKVKYVLTLQEGDPIEHIEKTAKKLGPLSWNLFTRGFTKADAITAISNYLSNWAKTLNKKVEPILVYNGANQKDLANEVDAKDVETIKQKIGKKEGDVFLVNTSRVVHQKGIDTVVRALPLLPKNIKFVAVGDGDKMDEYKALAQELGVADRVVFAGRVDRNQTPVYRKASDIFVATSRSEGLGSTFLSAMASGLPLITTGVGGIADYAFDGKTAYIVPVDDPAAIAKKVEQVLKEKDEAKTICSNARRLIEEEYNWDSVTKKMIEKVFDYVLLTQNSKYSTEEARRAPLG